MERERKKKRFWGFFIWFEDHQQNDMDPNKKSPTCYIEDGKVQIYRQASVNGIISNKEKKGRNKPSIAAWPKDIERHVSNDNLVDIAAINIVFFFFLFLGLAASTSHKCR